MIVLNATSIIYRRRKYMSTDRRQPAKISTVLTTVLATVYFPVSPDNSLYAECIR